MQSFDIALWPGATDNVGTANLNGTHVTFALLSSVLIVRADVPTDVAVDTGVPTLHLACNHVNSFAFGTKTTVMDRGEKMVIRSERDILVAAGMTDRQFSTSLREAVDAVLGSQQAIAEAAEEILKEEETE